MEDLSLDQLKNTVNNLVEETKCPVCYNSLRPPVIQCNKGHAVCFICKISLKQCPLCRAPFPTPSPKSVLLNNVLELIPNACCRDGCEVLVTPGDDHEVWCGYRVEDCMFPDCVWYGCAKDIVDHVTNFHEDKTITKETSSTLSTLCFTKSFLNSETCLYPYAVIAQNTFCWLLRKSNIKENTFELAFDLIPNGKLKKPFRIGLMLGDYKKSYSSSVTLTPENVFTKDGTTMRFLRTELLSLVNDDGDLPISVTLEHVD